MTSAAKTITGRDLVADAAKQAFDEADGDVRAATAAMERKVLGDRVLRDALTAPLIQAACYEAVTAQCRALRRRVWIAPRHETSTPESGRVVALATGTLAMFPLPGGKRLGEATRDEISAAADFYARQAGDMAFKARWLRLVAQSLTGTKKVKDALSDERLHELQEAARHE